MFHVTTILGKHKPPENVFTHCPHSGEEVCVDLSTVLSRRNFTPDRFYMKTMMGNGTIVSIPITCTNASKEKKKSEPKPGFIDDVWPSVRP